MHDPWDILDYRELSYIQNLGVSTVHEFLQLPIKSLLRLGFGMQPVFLNSILQKISTEYLSRIEQEEENEDDLSTEDVKNMIKFLVDKIE